MPWVWVGRFCFDLGRVEVVERAVGPEGGVTITLLNGKTVDLSYGDAICFLSAWEEHASARSLAEGPRPVLTPVLIVPGESDRSGQPRG